MSSSADDMGRLAERIRLPWRQDAIGPIHAMRYGDQDAGRAVYGELDSFTLSLEIGVARIEGESIDALCDRARKAVVELLAAMLDPPLLVDAEWSPDGVTESQAIEAIHFEGDPCPRGVCNGHLRWQLASDGSCWEGEACDTCGSVWLFDPPRPLAERKP